MVTHLSAEFIGIPAEQLRDSALLGGLLIAACAAVGLTGAHVARVQKADGGLSSAMMGDGSQITIHSYPEQQLLLFDGLGPPSHDFRKAVEVLSRRLTARDVRTALRERG